MNPRVVKVKAGQDHLLKLTFEGGEERLFNVKPLLNKGIFKALKDPKAFNSVKVSYGTVEWKGGQDLCPDTLYEDSVPVSGRSVVAVRESRGVYKAVSKVKKPTKDKR